MDSIWAANVLDLLADGEWHDYEALLTIASLEVSDEKGIEVGQYYRNYRYIRLGKNIPAQTSLARLKTTSVGKRVVVTRCITNLVKKRRVELAKSKQGQYRSKPERIRLRPKG